MTSRLVSVYLTISSRICFVILLACFVANAATLPASFTETLVAGGLASPTAMEFAPDGRLFVCQQGGQLRVIKNGALLPTPFVTVTVDSSGERGLLGIAFDPNFASNNFVYVYYTNGTVSPRRNQVSRFTANGDVAVAGSELVILTLENLSATNHNGGAIHFGPDGKLYVAVGENAVASNSQTLSNRLGKMLRINSDGSIPSDNPFFNTATGLNRAIWSLGLRNPFTFAFQPNSGRMFINDVGQSTWEEINDGISGSNYGWPTTEGPTNNPSFRSPLFSYAHSPSDTGGCAITGGAFYNPATVQFPSNYVGKYFFADLCSGWIRVFDPATQTDAAFATGIPNPVDLRVGADGSLYYLAIGNGTVVKIQYPVVQQAPSITIPPSDQTVTPGQTATFQVVAGGSAPLSYQWQRHTNSIGGATSPTYSLPNVSLADNGAKFKVVITNAFGSITSNEVTLTVAAPPVINQEPSDSTVSQGQPASFQVGVVGTTPLNYLWKRNNVDLADSNSPTYTVASATLADNGAKFRCVITNAFGTANSIEVTLTVTAPPNITMPPADQTVNDGQPATFQVSATGSTPLSYQWQRNMVDLAGANSSSYTVSSATSADNGAKFRVVVTNAFGSATSNEATLTVTPPPPVLLTEVGNDRAIAFDSVTMMRDPFPLQTLFNFSADHRTRVILLASGADLLAGETSSAVTAQAEDSLLVIYPLTVEFVGKVPGFDWLTEVVVKLPETVTGNGDLLVSINLHGTTSNKVRIRIQ
ncbi:MAG TPA: PQQ-dependent sugar dehydrogenase [Pyrinomonadaceae bacterium]|nr:PQQ-dependent sugar dehydrogenase [Pyrinomonadaceae bacterium]